MLTFDDCVGMWKSALLYVVGMNDAKFGKGIRVVMWVEAFENVRKEGKNNGTVGV